VGFSAAGAASFGASAAASATALRTATRGMNFFFGLGNANSPPLLFWAVPPSAEIFAWADLLYQPAITVSFFFNSPSP
jgi:hypothetical protein